MSDEWTNIEDDYKVTALPLRVATQRLSGLS
jgi:hypothetical protein